MQTIVVRQGSITSKKGFPIHLSIDDFSFNEEDFADKQFVVQNANQTTNYYENGLGIHFDLLTIGEISAWMLPVGYTSNGIDYGFYEETMKLENGAFRFHYQWFTNHFLNIKEGYQIIYQGDFMSVKGNAVRLKTPFLDDYQELIFKIDKGQEDGRKEDTYLTYIPMYELGKNYETLLSKSFKSKGKEYFFWYCVSGGLEKGGFKMNYEWLVKCF